MKQLLRAADGRRGYGDTEAGGLVESVKGVVFIATPHTGSAHATLLDTLRLIAWPSPSTLDLVKNNANLRDLNVWYRNWASSIQHKVFLVARNPDDAQSVLFSVVPLWRLGELKGKGGRGDPGSRAGYPETASRRKSSRL